MEHQIDPAELLNLATEIVAAHLSNNKMDSDEVPIFIKDVYSSMIKLSNSRTFIPGRPEPATAIEDSVQPDYIVCLEDGKQLKMLKRHLKTSYNLTPDEYRERWGLSSDYPMVAPNYAKQRSNLAKSIGLGTHGSRRDREKVAA